MDEVDVLDRGSLLERKEIVHILAAYISIKLIVIKQVCPVPTSAKTQRKKRCANLRLR
jgi:hypothetical protein